MTSDWLPIRYRGYWDVPRIFLVQFQERLYLFNCPFSEALDEYPDVYKVFILPTQADDEIPNDWTLLSSRASCYVGEVPVAAVQFDPTRRAAIRTAVFDLPGAMDTKSLNGHLAHDATYQPIG